MTRKKAEDVGQLETETMETENTQLENNNPLDSQDMQEQSNNTQTDKIFGSAVTPENLAYLANVDIGMFPQTVALTNATSSELTFAEIGISLLPYEQQRKVTIRNQGALETFCMNYAYLSDLSQWDDNYGVFVQAVN